jgi:hypothetical protein
LRCPSCGAEQDREREDRLPGKSGPEAVRDHAERFFLSLPFLGGMTLLMTFIPVPIAVAAGAKLGTAMAIGGIFGLLLGVLGIVLLKVTQ